MFSAVTPNLGRLLVIVSTTFARTNAAGNWTVAESSWAICHPAVVVLAA